MDKLKDIPEHVFRIKTDREDLIKLYSKAIEKMQSDEYKNDKHKETKVKLLSDSSHTH